MPLCLWWCMCLCVWERDRERTKQGGVCSLARSPMLLQDVWRDDFKCGWNQGDMSLTGFMRFTISFSSSVCRQMQNILISPSVCAFMLVFVLPRLQACMLVICERSISFSVCHLYFSTQLLRLTVRPEDRSKYKMNLYWFYYHECSRWSFTHVMQWWCFPSGLERKDKSALRVWSVAFDLSHYYW